MSVVTDVRFGADPDRQSEQALREDLAAAFRLAVKFGWSESVGNHFSAAVSEDGSKFLMNPKLLATLFNEEQIRTPLLIW